MRASLIFNWPVLLALVTLATACSTSRYQQAVDSLPEYRTPERMAKIHAQPEPQPFREPLSRRGNADEYQVWGKTYQVQKGLTTYTQQGVASWYGQKFHGHETSNGEIFDVFEFTAAHKSLPLPSYVRVTNLTNQKSLIVRVNDRGPFHGNRLIDLSYAAAVRLGFAQSGTANVQVDLVAAPLMDDDYMHIQVEAFSQRTSAENLKQQIERFLNDDSAAEIAAPVYIFQEERRGQPLHKVRIGPISPDLVNTVQQVLLSQNMNPGMLVSAPAKPVLVLDESPSPSIPERSGKSLQSSAVAAQES